MKRALVLLAIAMLAGCASAPASSSSAPPLQVSLLQRGTPAADVYYFRGPINIQYDLAVKNPTFFNFRPKAGKPAPWSHGYHHLFETDLRIGAWGHVLHGSAVHWIDDGLMS